METGILAIPDRVLEAFYKSPVGRLVAFRNRKLTIFALLSGSDRLNGGGPGFQRHTGLAAAFKLYIYIGENFTIEQGAVQCPVAIFDAKALAKRVE